MIGLRNSRVLGYGYFLPVSLGTICASVFSFSPNFLVSIRSHSISIRTVYSTVKETGSSLVLNPIRDAQTKTL